MPLTKDPEGIAPCLLHQLIDFSGKQVLEVGCGDGKLTWTYADDTAHVTGIDPNEEKISAARENTPAELCDRIQFTTNSIAAFSPPTEKGMFDVALFGWSL